MKLLTRHSFEFALLYLYMFVMKGFLSRFIFTCTSESVHNLQLLV